MPDLSGHIVRRAMEAGLQMERAVIDRLVGYVSLLARWNEKINLTTLPLHPPTDDAIDRLLIEPLVAAARIRSHDRLAVDVGSGGGSPAIPLKIAAPRLRMVLVESKLKKAAFLREVVRQLELPETEIENRRLEELAARVDLRGHSDVITLRAVTPTQEVWGTIQLLLRTDGRLFWFGGQPDAATPPAMEAAFRQSSTEIVQTPPHSQIAIVAV